MRDVVAAFLSAVDAGSVQPVYLRGKVPNSPPASYMVIDVATPRPGDYSHAATSSSRAWRLSTLYVGTSPESCLFRAEEAETALLDVRLTVAGKSCSKLKREPGRVISKDPDVESVFSGSDDWLFVTANA